MNDQHMPWKWRRRILGKRGRVVGGENLISGQHTPAPWIASALEGIGERSSSVIILSHDYQEIIASFIDNKANADRIVACVNCCEGVPTQKIEGLISLRTILRFLNEATETRDLYSAYLEYHNIDPELAIKYVRYRRGELGEDFNG